MSAPDEEPKWSRSAAAFVAAPWVTGGGGHHQVVDGLDVGSAGGGFGGPQR